MAGKLASSFPEVFVLLLNIVTCASLYVYTYSIHIEPILVKLEISARHQTHLLVKKKKYITCLFGIGSSLLKEDFELLICGNSPGFGVLDYQGGKKKLCPFTSPPQ